MYKLFIPTAGSGTRSGYDKINKALITVGERPVIAHIIDKFPKDVPIVVALGFKGSEVSQVLAALYPDRHIERVWVDDYTVGPGHSINAARARLQCPFVFCCNDTLILEDIALDPSINGNWLAYSIKNDDTSDYRTVSVSLDRKVLKIHPKGYDCDAVYTGLAGVRDYQQFWKVMGWGASIGAGEVVGLSSLSDVNAIRRSWFDTGTGSKIAIARVKYQTKFNILEKKDEAIWFTDDHVIKFNADPKVIDLRLKRMQFLPNELLPEVVHKNKNLFAYRRIHGQTLSKIITPAIFKDLFDKMLDRVWRLNEGYQTKMAQACVQFYKVKTYQRLAEYLSRAEAVSRTDVINGIEVPSVEALLSRVDWSRLCEPFTAAFHGDFHNENILLTPAGEFKLLDWRQDFGGLIDVGDVYYDLAKFNAKLLVSDDVIAHDRFSVYATGDNSVDFRFDRPVNLVDTERAFNQWVVDHNFDLGKVNTLTALIFINIASLHNYPYSELCYYLGRNMLYTEVMSR